MRSAPSPSTMARSSTSTRSSSGRPAPASTSPPRITPGSVGPTKTPTAWCDSTCPSARAWPTSPSTIAIGSLRNSTAGRGSGWAIGLRRNAMRGKTQCCTSQLISDGCIASLANDRSLSPYLQQRNLVIDQDETVRDLNWATRERAGESCSHRHGGLVLDSVQRLYRILVLGFRVLLPGLYRVQTPNCATLIVHHRFCGKTVRQALHVGGGLRVQIGNQRRG